MIARVLTPTGSTGSVLDYNEKKMTEGNASLVATENLPDNTITTIYDTFDELERNPAIAEQVRSKSFHMTLGPGPQDDISEEQCIECIREVMNELGYGRQPYVIYRHFDIDRVHYHVVSSRISQSGRAISSKNEARRLLSVMRKLGPKYGFVVGVDKEKLANSDLPTVPVKEYSPSDPNSLYTLKSLFEEALQYDFHSLYQFGCVMLAMNVKARLWMRRDGQYNISLQGLDENGNKSSRVYSLEKHLNYPGVEMYNRRLEENNAIGVLQMERKVAVKEISDYCLENTGSADDYCAAIEEAGVRHVMQRDERTGTIKRLTLVEKNTRTIVDSAIRGELSIVPMVEAEKNGRWKTDGRKKKHKPGSKVGADGRMPFFTPERTAALKQRIVLAIERFRGEKSPAPRIKGNAPTLKLK